MPNTPITDDKLALQRLYHWERSAPDAITLTQPMGDGTIKTFTWREVANGARRMAAHLQAQNFEPGSKIAILSKNCAWWLMSDLAIWMAGYVSVPLYPTLAHETIQQILTHSESRLCFIGKLDGWVGMKPGVPAGLPCISYPLSPTDAKSAYPGWDEICARTTPLAGEPVRPADELCTLIYTSGTTGNAKGVMHSFGNFAWAIHTGVKRFGLTGADRMLSYLPLSHVVERMLVEHGWLECGMSLYFADSLDTFAADLQRARPTVFFSVPRLWVKFQQGVQQKLPPKKLNLLLKIPLINSLIRRKVHKALGLDQCRIAVGGAAPMPLALLEWYAKLGIPVNEGYGMTENLCVSHITVPGQNQRGTVGRVYDGVEARIDAATGELQMRSKALMLGYYKEPELSRQAFTEDGWLHTGDKGVIDAAGSDTQGCLRITGRVKDLFKTSKGKYVSPAHIEDRLGTDPTIEACVVTGANLAQPLGLVMLSPNAALLTKDALEAQLAAHLAEVNTHLDPHEQLDCLVLLKTPWTIENGFLTPTMKVKRPRIEEVYAAQYEGWVGQRKTIVWGD